MQIIPPISSKGQALVVSLHDVAPQTQSAVEAQIKDLKALGVDRCSLLVISDYHHHGALTAHPQFVAWLHEQVACGHEVVLHGYYHLRPERPNEGMMTRSITRCYTAGEGEFFDLSFEEAREKLRQGMDELDAAGFQKKEVVGFIAPAWLLSAKAEQALCEEGFAYTTRLGGVIDLRKIPSVYYPSQSMVYSVRSEWRRAVSLLWNEGLFRYAQYREWPLLRLGLHPPDWKYPAIRRHALSSVERALKNRTPVTYRDWVIRLKAED